MPHLMPSCKGAQLDHVFFLIEKHEVEVCSQSIVYPYITYNLLPNTTINLGEFMACNILELITDILSSFVIKFNLKPSEK